jgi:putative glutamine amidotransferase
MKPIILITAGKAGQLIKEPGEVQAVKSVINMQYVDSVLRAGGAPVTLPCVADPEAVRAAVEAADGILLPGGGDVVSHSYGEEPHPRTLYQDPQRDEMEFAVTRRALDTGRPILGICRGAQVLNVAFGGSLIQDVPSQVPEAILHYTYALEPWLAHTTDIEEDTLLSRIFGTPSMRVNTYHHQAVKDIGDGLRVNCRARDGVIEGVEATDGRPILGVQFHPEELTAPYPQFQPLFDWLVREAGSRG